MSHSYHDKDEEEEDDDSSCDGSVELELDVSQSGGSQSHTSESNHTHHESHTGSDEGLEKSKESKAISRSKILVLSIIVIAAAVIGTISYVYMRNEETNTFETEFYNFASTLVDDISRESQRMYAAVHNFGTGLTSFTVATNMTWPFVTLPDFELRGVKNNQISKSIQLTFSPLVTVENRAQWEAYAIDNQGWLTESLALQGPNPVATAQTRRHLASTTTSIPTHIWQYLGNSNYPVIEAGNGVEYGPGNYGPVWQQAPAPTNASIVNYDLLTNPDIENVYKTMWETKMPVLSPVLNLDFLYNSAVAYNSSNPTSFLMNPVYPFLANNTHVHHRDDLVGFLIAIIPWNSYFRGILPIGINGMTVVVNNTCGNVFSYELDGPNVTYLGPGDWHDAAFNDMQVAAPFADFLIPNATMEATTESACMYTILIYPSVTLQQSYASSKPAVYTTVVILVFFFTAMVFVLYDWLVQRRQTKVAATAKRTAAIVASLFPSNVRDRILKEAEEQAEQEIKNKKKGIRLTAPKAQLKDFLSEEAERTKAFDTKPIADLFPETTVCFADLVGFTAWSSVREPAHVFQLLEALFGAFDAAARRRRVFKVETVGDCYVAVTGLPDPRKDHAVVMCRFARDCLQVMNDLTKRLEVALGPDTGDLSIRFGLHSGPVTAGVLRGDKSRFQLFGDTVNVASRIESTGERNRIHISQETADLLVAAGKGHWIEERKDKIHAKGKGELQTYWLTMRLQSGSSTRSGSTHSSAERDDASIGDMDDNKSPYLSKAVSVPNSPFDDKTQRLVEWNTDVLARLLKLVVARRLTSESVRVEGMPNDSVHGSANDERKTVLDEVVEIIHLPEFDVRSARGRVDAEKIELGDAVMQQLRDYVTIIASMYRDNPFHNFEHASHVTMSVVKLLSRIVAPDLQVHEHDDENNVASTLHDHTYGITSDPLTQFACVFAALIHDVDHLGVPNTQLVKERTYIASLYKEKSVAEQNSVTVSWNLLMDVSFKDLRMAIYSNTDEKQRFRQLVVNSVMATDIMDKDLKALRNARWDKAFKEAMADESTKDAVDRKATIVIEHLIQASDIAHTMQHWHIYRKWNERLFHEMYKAYVSGRADKDPSEFWYKGEIGFFDFYIIPLAKKLKDCGVFGVSSDEYLNYAEKNRKEWEVRGLEVVASMVEKYKTQFDDEEVRLDELQDEERAPRRSDLLDTDSGDGSSDDGMVKDFGKKVPAAIETCEQVGMKDLEKNVEESTQAEQHEAKIDLVVELPPRQGATCESNLQRKTEGGIGAEATSEDGLEQGESTLPAARARSIVSPEQMLFL